MAANENPRKHQHNIDSATNLKVKPDESKQREGKRSLSSHSDSRAEDEELKSTRRRGKRKRNIDSETDLEAKHPESKQRKESPNHNRDAVSGADRGESSKKERKSGNFRKKRDDTQRANEVDTCHTGKNAVGFIRGLIFSGTGFRVGTDKIMTAYHVVEAITRPSENAEPDLSKLEGDDIYIKFNFFEDEDSLNTRKFYIKKLCVHDKKMDFAILQLREQENPERPDYPDPIKRFKRVPTDRTFTLIGHPNWESMQLDQGIKIFDPKSDQGRERLESMEEWWRERSKPWEYNNINDENKVLFDCWVQHGASGSPGIEMNSDGEPVCSLMLIHGYPDSAFDDEYKIKEEDHPYMIEEGVTMKAIADFLDTSDEKELRHEIFADNSFK